MIDSHNGCISNEDFKVYKETGNLKVRNKICDPGTGSIS
jgi:hypothetical protein